MNVVWNKFLAAGSALAEDSAGNTVAVNYGGKWMGSLESATTIQASKEFYDKLKSETRDLCGPGQGTAG